MAPLEINNMTNCTQNGTSLQCGDNWSQSRGETNCLQWMWTSVSRGVRIKNTNVSSCNDNSFQLLGFSKKTVTKSARSEQILPCSGRDHALDLWQRHVKVWGSPQPWWFSQALWAAWISLKDCTEHKKSVVQKVLTGVFRCHWFGCKNKNCCIPFMKDSMHCLCIVQRLKSNCAHFAQTERTLTWWAWPILCALSHHGNGPFVPHFKNLWIFVKSRRPFCGTK